MACLVDFVDAVRTVSSSGRDYLFELAAGLPEGTAVAVADEGARVTLGIRPQALLSLLCQVRRLVATADEAGADAAAFSVDDLTRAELICAPMTYTTWNRRKAMLQSSHRTPAATGIGERDEGSATPLSSTSTDACPSALFVAAAVAEQRFVSAIQRMGHGHLKWPEIWAHRRWLLHWVVGTGAAGASAGDTITLARTAPGAHSCVPRYACCSGGCILGFVQAELDAAEVGCRKYPRNYHAWSYRAHVARTASRLLRRASPQPAASANLTPLTPVREAPELQAATSRTPCIGADAEGDLSLAALFLLQQLDDRLLPTAKVLGRTDASLQRYRGELLTELVALSQASSGSGRSCPDITLAASAALLCELLLLLPRLRRTASDSLATLASTLVESPLMSTSHESGLDREVVVQIDCTFTVAYALMQWCGIAPKLACAAAAVSAGDSTALNAAIGAAVPQAAAIAGLIRALLARGTLRERLPPPAAATGDDMPAAAPVVLQPGGDACGNSIRAVGLPHASPAQQLAAAVADCAAQVTAVVRSALRCLALGPSQAERAEAGVSGSPPAAAGCDAVVEDSAILADGKEMTLPTLAALRPAAASLALRRKLTAYCSAVLEHVAEAPSTSV